jgi:two-component system chemotaxis response regulator CheY
MIMEKKILVIDDKEYITSSLKFSLGKEGFKIFVSNDGGEALDCFNNNEIDLILTDIHMPGMNGLEFIKTLRKTSKGSTIPILILTSDVDSKNEAKITGATGWIQKPFSFKALLTAINKLLEKH